MSPPFYSALEGQHVGRHDHPRELLEDASEVKQPPFYRMLPIADLEHASPETLLLLRDISLPITGEEGQDVIPSLFRHFVPWPGFLAILSTALRPLLESNTFHEKIEALQVLTRREVARWPFPVTVGPQVLKDAGYSVEAIEDLKATWQRFQRMIPSMVVLGTAVVSALPTDTGR